MNPEIKNKKASFAFHLTDRFVAGIQLTGTEVKSIRNGKASITEAYCRFKGDELFVLNMYIAEYDNGGYANHQPRRERKLLLQRHELNKLKRKIKDIGLAIVPTLLFFNEKGLAKVEIYLAKGKKVHDKREDLKTKDMKRERERGRD
jgi:SsrA-binding protein